METNWAVERDLLRNT